MDVKKGQDVDVYVDDTQIQRNRKSLEQVWLNNTNTFSMCHFKQATRTYESNTSSTSFKNSLDHSKSVNIVAWAWMWQFAIHKKGEMRCPQL